MYYVIKISTKLTPSLPLLTFTIKAGLPFFTDLIFARDNLTAPLPSTALSIPLKKLDVFHNPQLLNPRLMKVFGPLF